MEEDNTLDGRLFRSYFEILRYMCKTYIPINYEQDKSNIIQNQVGHLPMA